MGVNMGIVTVRGPDYPPTRRIRQAASEAGHRVSLIDPYRLWPMLMRGRLHLEGRLDLEDLAVILPRQGAQIGASSLLLLRSLEQMGLPLVNRVSAIEIARNQMASLQRVAAVGLPVPDTCFVNSAAGFRHALQLLGGPPVVVKPCAGRQGRGVELFSDPEPSETFLATRLDPKRGLLVQRFLPPDGRRDLRLLVIGSRVVAAMELRSAAGDFRANYHLTGFSRPFQPSPDLRRLALRATGAAGLDIAGVDLIIDRRGNPFVLELNYAPGFRGLEAATKLDIAAMIVAHAAEFAAAGSGSRNRCESRT